MEADDDLTSLAAVSAHFIDTLAGIDDDDWLLPTPCSEWNLSELIDHVTGGNRFTCRILAGEGADEALDSTRASFAAGHESATGAKKAMEQLTEAFLAPGILGRDVHHVAGVLSGRQVLRLRLHDLIIHSWDVVQTIEPPATLPQELVQWGTGELAEPDSLTARHFGTALLHPGEEADALELYLAAFGRSR